MKRLRLLQLQFQPVAMLVDEDTLEMTQFPMQAGAVDAATLPEWLANFQRAFVEHAAVVEADPAVNPSATAAPDEAPAAKPQRVRSVG